MHRSPGGSSSGSGAVVAAGIVPLSIGTDTGGSVRIPAAFNGIVGYKTSTGHHPMAGVFPLSRSFDTLGPLARTVEDCVLADAVLRGLAAPEVAAADAAALDFVVPDAVMLDDLDPGVAQAFEVSLARIEASGARLRRIALPELREVVELGARLGPLGSAESLDVHAERIAGPDAARMDPRVVRRMRMGERMTAVDLIRLHDHRRRLIASAAERLGDAILLCPTTPEPPCPSRRSRPTRRCSSTIISAPCGTPRWAISLTGAGCRSRTAAMATGCPPGCCSTPAMAATGRCWPQALPWNGP